MYSNPQWEWFHTRGMCALSSDPVMLSFFKGLHDTLDIKTLLWSLWLLIYIIPPSIYLKIYSGILAAVNIYIVGFLAPIPAPCILPDSTPNHVFSFDELIMFPSLVMILLRATFLPLKKELSTWFFWSNFICVIVCTGCVSLIIGRSNLLMVGVTNAAVLLGYLYAIWTPACLRLVESIIILVILCVYDFSSHNADFELAFKLALMGVATSLLVPLLFSIVERTSFSYVLSAFIKPIAFLERRKKSIWILQYSSVGLLRAPLLCAMYETMLLLLIVVGLYSYQRPLL